ncbi:MAG: hypothetical protein YK1309IOTA_1910003 [Marine Group I thaumarchaeote]|nr:MAG: hypothetical protein YK1309IOTA_1910003 [Marine Group I thaumarchaeote]
MWIKAGLMLLEIITMKLMSVKNWIENMTTPTDTNTVKIRNETFLVTSSCQ